MHMCVHATNAEQPGIGGGKTKENIDNSTAAGPQGARHVHTRRRQSQRRMHMCVHATYACVCADADGRMLHATHSRTRDRTQERSFRPSKAAHIRMHTCDTHTSTRHITQERSICPSATAHRRMQTCDTHTRTRHGAQERSISSGATGGKARAYA